MNKIANKKYDIPIIVILGPTASGKTSLAINIAKKYSGEIISCDSMQIYKDMNIGTAKPSLEEMQDIPHHLINEFPISEYIDVFKYISLMESKICEISKRGNLPIIAGGSGMYARSLLYGLDTLPGDKKLRKELDEKYDNPESFKELKKVMQEIDPEDFNRWEKHQRKLIRALEVFELTGKSITELQTLHKPVLRYPAKVFSLNWDREILKERIKLRTSQMLENGWIEETEKLIEEGIFETPTAWQVLGYSIINEHLQGKISYEETAAKIATKTWQYARKQLTWFNGKHPEAEKLIMPMEISEIYQKINFNCLNNQE